MNQIMNITNWKSIEELYSYFAKALRCEDLKMPEMIYVFPDGELYLPKANLYPSSENALLQGIKIIGHADAEGVFLYPVAAELFGGKGYYPCIPNVVFKDL